MATSVSYAVGCWTALGTNVQLLVHPEPAGPAAVARAAELLTEVDLSCSRFRAESDLSRVNRCAGEWVEISEVLSQALAVALAAAQATQGIVDPTLGLVLAGLGYDRDYTEVRKGATRRGPAAQGPAAIAVPQAVGSWRDVELAPRAVRIPFGRALDLGATGKAFASDLIARTLHVELGVDVMVSVGGDVAVGGVGGHDWQVVVCEVPEQTRTTAGKLAPMGDDDELVSLSRGGLTTSSVVWRRWQHDGREMHHLIDPRIGAPARPVWRTASVIGPDCATANAASTASVVLGEGAVDWLAAQQLGGLERSRPHPIGSSLCMWGSALFVGPHTACRQVITSATESRRSLRGMAHCHPRRWRVGTVACTRSLLVNPRASEQAPGRRSSVSAVIGRAVVALRTDRFAREPYRATVGRGGCR